MALILNVSISLQEVHVSYVKLSLAQQVALGKSAFVDQFPGYITPDWGGREETAAPGSVMLLTTKYLLNISAGLVKRMKFPSLFLMRDPSKTNTEKQSFSRGLYATSSGAEQAGLSL